MLSAVALIPSAPVMVTPLVAGAAAELAELNTAVLNAATALPDAWVAVGVGETDEVVGSDAVGTFAGFGADIRVGLRPGSDGVPARLPLCALITGWVRGRANLAARADVRVYSKDHGADAALALGRALRVELDGAAESIGVLIVADGANTLTPPAPGGHDPDSVPVQEALDDALAAGDVAALIDLPVGILGRVAYQVLAGLTEPGPAAARELYRGAPYGVAYFVGVWTPVLGVPPLAGESAATRESTE